MNLTSREAQNWQVYWETRNLTGGELHLTELPHESFIWVLAGQVCLTNGISQIQEPVLAQHARFHLKKLPISRNFF
jgi:hypothetical protein